MRLAIFVTVLGLLGGRALAAPCTDVPAFKDAAAQNARSVEQSAWTFTPGREGAREGPGWAVYLPLTAETIKTSCGVETTAFAAALAKWQGRNGLKPTGLMTSETAAKLTVWWHQARRRMKKMQKEPCPHAEEGALVEVSKRDIWGKPEKLLPGAYDAYRRMMTAAHAEAPDIFSGNANLAIVSAWRTEERDKETCKTRACSDVSMARSCSVHWSGAAMDLNVGYIDGHSPADMDWANRLYQVYQPAYRWLLKNAAKFGFANYFAEPWHWEWNGR